jgi:hypothetical protein
MKHPSWAKEGHPVKCVNCHNEIDGAPMVCPFCHTNPIIFGSEPYDGLKHINNPGPYSPEITLGVLGAVFLPVLPPVSGVLWGLAGLSLVSKWWQRRK